MTVSKKPLLTKLVNNTVSMIQAAKNGVKHEPAAPGAGIGGSAGHGQGSCATPKASSLIRESALSASTFRAMFTVPAP